MIVGEKEYLESISQTHVCPRHGPKLVVAWHACVNGYVLRCGEGHFPEEVTREKTPTQEYKEGSRESHEPKLDLMVREDLGTGNALSATQEAELIDTLNPRETERVIVKCRYSAFAGTPLEMILRSLNVEDLIVGGVMTNLCCGTTARDAFNRDFHVFFLGDGTAPANEELHTSSLKNISYGFGRVLGVSEALQVLRGQVLHGR